MKNVLDFKKYFRLLESQDFNAVLNQWKEEQKKSGVKFHDYLDVLRGFMNDKSVDPKMKEVARQEHDRHQESGDSYR
jgi:hypothetical protein